MCLKNQEKNTVVSQIEMIVKLPFYLFILLFSSFLRPVLPHPATFPPHLPTNFLSGKALPHGSCADLHSHAVSFQGFLSLSFLFLFIDGTANGDIQAYAGLVERANMACCFHKYRAAAFAPSLCFSGILLPLLVRRQPLGLW